MPKIILSFCLCVFIFSSCSESCTPEDVSVDYCACAQLSNDEKTACIQKWALKYKGRIKKIEDRKVINYNMIECNGFEGDNDFYRKLMDD